MSPQRIKQLLDSSAARLDDTTLARLGEIRTQALQHHVVQHTHALAFPGHGKHTHWHSTFQHHKLSYWVAGLLLVASILSGIAYWQQTSSTDTSDVDIAILTDDLPIQVYVD